MFGQKILRVRRMQILLLIFEKSFGEREALESTRLPLHKWESNVEALESDEMPKPRDKNEDSAECLEPKSRMVWMYNAVAFFWILRIEFN